MAQILRIKLDHLEQSEAKTPMHYCVDKFAERSEFSVVEIINGKPVDITNDLKKMLNENAIVYVFGYPQGVETIAVVSIIISAITAVAAFLLAPSAPDANATSGSIKKGNNRLSSRNNEIKIDNRIPDIVGSVYSTPDVIMPEYTFFTNQNNEAKVGLYCVGRGKIDVEDLKDGSTLFTGLNGYHANIYDVNADVNTEDFKDIVNGGTLDKVYRFSEIAEAVSAVIRAPNDEIVGFEPVGSFFRRILVQSPEPYGPRSGYKLIGTAANDPSQSIIADPEDIYVYSFSDIEIQNGSEILNLMDSELLDWETDPSEFSSTVMFPYYAFGAPPNPANWARMQLDVDYTINSMTIEGGQGSISAPQFTDWFTFSRFAAEQIWVNVVCPKGLYYYNNTKKNKLSVNFEIEYQKLDSNLDPFGSVISTTGSITDDRQGFLGTTIKITNVNSRFKIRLKRTNNSSQDAAYVDEIQIGNIYGMSLLDDAGNSVSQMGNITTIKTRRQAVNKGSQLANSVLNCVAKELVQVYSDQDTKAILWTQNNDGTQSIIRLALDPQIGKLSPEDLDINQLLATKTEIDNYFGSSAGTQASFTFDNSEQSAQVIIKTIADALNCQAYRQFSTIKLKFEKPNVPRMLFTFRSKAPESDTIQRKSLTREYPTGVEIKWLDTSGQQKSIKVPDDSQQNYKNIELHCIDNYAQAKWRAWREYYKLTYGLITYNSELSPESKLLLINDVIQSSDDTRIYPSAGYIISISDSTLTLSQDVSFEAGKEYTIILKDRDGTIESFGATGTGTTDTVTIDATPTIEIYTGINESKTEFYFCEDTEENAQTWLIQSVSFSEKYNKVSAINYNPIYYSKDGT